jgi:NAD(P)-dependent dehydrogenase (short-subunit alcohol dehydrogenase family)
MAGGRLDGKVAVITGGASGMGRATAMRFLSEGARVVVADMNEKSGADTLAEVEGAGLGARARFVRVDVAHEPDVEKMIALAVADFGRVDCVFNNAGIGGAIGPLTETETEDWDATFAVLVRGVFLGIKHGARAMQRAKSEGTIINTASVAGLSGGDGPAAYSAAKAAVINLTRAAAVELAPHRIRVNAICPGGILTQLVHRGSPEAVRPVLEKMQPWPEAGLGEHIAGAALFLASDDSRFVTGDALVVDGGLTAAGPNVRGRFAAQRSDHPLANVVAFDRGSTGLDPIVRKLS